VSAAEKLPDVLLRLGEVERRVSLRKTAIYAAIAAGTFPAPTKFGTASRWVEAEIQQWIDDLKAERDGDRNGDRQKAA